jgi:hypothetical protein
MVQHKLQRASRRKCSKLDVAKQIALACDQAKDPLQVYKIFFEGGLLYDLNSVKKGFTFFKTLADDPNKRWSLLPCLNAVKSD